MSDHDIGRIMFGPISGSGRSLLMEDIQRFSEPKKSVGVREAFMKKVLKFLPDAQAARGRSKDRSTQVGAVVLDDDFNIRISGYNGMPRGVNDDVGSRHERPMKYAYASHAEENCVAQAARIGVSLKGCTILLTSLFPCSTCARLIIQSGIKRVIAPSKVENTRWDAQGAIALEMFAEAGVEVLYYGEEK